MVKKLIWPVYVRLWAAAGLAAVMLMQCGRLVPQAAVAEATASNAELKATESNATASNAKEQPAVMVLKRASLSTGELWEDWGG